MGIGCKTGGMASSSFRKLLWTASKIVDKVRTVYIAEFRDGTNADSSLGVDLSIRKPSIKFGEDRVKFGLGGGFGHDGRVVKDWRAAWRVYIQW